MNNIIYYSLPTALYNKSKHWASYDWFPSQTKLIIILSIVQLLLHEV